MTKSRNILPPRRYWSNDELSYLRQQYADMPTLEMAEHLDRDLRSVYVKAQSMGLKKSAAFLASDAAGRITKARNDPRLQATQFKPGHSTWNKGKKGSTGLHPNSRKNHFRPGVKPITTMPLGSLRVVTYSNSHNSAGHQYLEIKTSESKGGNHKRWTPVTRYVWERANGAVPAGHIVIFKKGMATLVFEDITPDKLECISRAENARRNHPVYRSPELAKLVQLKGAITRQVNRIARQQQEQEEKSI